MSDQPTPAAKELEEMYGIPLCSDPSCHVAVAHVHPDLAGGVRQTPHPEAPK